MKKILFACGVMAGCAQALEVHEWGTFTVLSGSSGNQVLWHSPAFEIARLPTFVHPGFADIGKAATAHRMRMETPVIYFYPEKPMKIAVEANFVGGMITETYPFSPNTISLITPNGPLTNHGAWSGKLIPPTDKAALARIPAIPAAEHEEPYGAAREVPDAWIFESDVKEIPGREVQPPFPETEKFIFYRGAGDASLPVNAMINGSNVTVINNALGALSFGTALRVRSGKASWISIPPVSTFLTNGKPTTNNISVKLPEADRSLDDVESELAAAWKAALTKDGLTAAEASAMVETWRGTWFRENGDRVLTLVPRANIDAMLPLKITPQPAKTERVFVARIEMVSTDRERSLVRLLNSGKQNDPQELAELEQLALGRFANGAVEVATEIQKHAMLRKFNELNQMKALARANDRTTGPE